MPHPARDLADVARREHEAQRAQFVRERLLRRPARIGAVAMRMPASTNKRALTGPCPALAIVSHGNGIASRKSGALSPLK